MKARVGIDQNPSLRYLPRNSLNDTRNPVTPSVAKAFCVSRKICQYPFTSRPLSFYNFPVSFCWSFCWRLRRKGIKQLWIAVSVYVLVAIVRKQLKIEASMFTILQILSVSAFDKTPLPQLLAQPELQTLPDDSHNQLLLFNQ